MKRLCYFANACCLLPSLLGTGDVPKARLRIKNFNMPPPVIYEDAQIMKLWVEAQKAYNVKNYDRFFNKAFPVLEKAIEKEYCSLTKKLARNIEFYVKVEKLHGAGFIKDVDVNQILEIRKWRNSLAHEGEDLGDHAETVYKTVAALLTGFTACKQDS